MLERFRVKSSEFEFDLEFTNFQRSTLLYNITTFSTKYSPCPQIFFSFGSLLLTDIIHK